MAIQEDWILHEADLDSKIIMKTVGGMANRQGARDLKVSPETINRHIASLARHSMLFHQQMIVTSQCGAVVGFVDLAKLHEWSEGEAARKPDPGDGTGDDGITIRDRRFLE